MQQISKFLRGTKINAEIWDFSELSLKLMINSRTILEKIDDRLSVEDIVSISTDNRNFNDISVEIFNFLFLGYRT